MLGEVEVEVEVVLPVRILFDSKRPELRLVLMFSSGYYFLMLYFL
jgi:hypothetical protein